MLNGNLGIKSSPLVLMRLLLGDSFSVCYFSPVAVSFSSYGDHETCRGGECEVKR